MSIAAKFDFADLGVDALLVSGLPNVQYLTTFRGSNGLLLLAPGTQILFTDPRYAIQAVAEASDAEVQIVKSGPLLDAAVKWLARRRLRKVGFERTRLGFDGYQFLREKLPAATKLVPLANVVETMRMIKTPDEIAKIRRSVLTNSAAFDRAQRAIRPKSTELDLAAEIDYQMRRLGAEKPAFDTIVAAGAHSALPHAHPGAQKLAGHELLLVDMGATQDGYTSDMTRTLFLRKPSNKMRSVYRGVLNAQTAAIEAVREGVTAHSVDRAARRTLADAGLEKYFMHSTGHGLGLEIHESPRLGPKDQTRLAAGMVITIEPGAYLEGLGGVRIEDTVLVTKTGFEVLTPTSKELTTL